MADTPWTPGPGDSEATLLTAMLAKARAEKLWFFCNYQELWFSPDQIEQHWKNGRFCWGAVNWKLRPRRERLAELDQELTALAKECARVAAEVPE